MSPQSPHLLLSGPRPSTSSSQPRCPAQLADISDYFIAQTGRPQAKHRWGLNFACPPPPKPQSQRTQWTAIDQVGAPLPCSCWWSVVTANPCSWLAWVNPFHWSTNSNQGSATRGGYTQPTQRAHLEYPAWVIEEAVLLDITGHLLH